MTYLLDTDIIIYWLNGEQQIETKAMAVGLEQIHTSTVSKAELYFGAYNSTYVEQNLQNIDRLSETITILPFDDKAARLFGQLKSQLKQAGQLILDADLMIAAIALANDLTLITNNVAHFARISNLTIENWRE